MSYIPTAFAHLAFVWKLYHFGLGNKIDRKELDIPLTFQDVDKKMLFVLPDKIFDTDDDLILALENNLTIAFGAAVIVLDSECSKRPNDIVSENDQCRHLIYQIRNAFAHNMAEPIWEIRNEKFRRIYKFGDICADLSSVNGKGFGYEDIGGPDALERIKDFAIQKHLTNISLGI